MKKTILLFLILALIAGLCACGAEEQNGAETQGTTAPVLAEPLPEQTEAAPATEAQQAAPEYFAFTAEGVELIPGRDFDPGVLPEPEFTYDTPSCAFEGTDHVYGYGTYELTACDEGGGQFIYSIYFTDANITTPEGLALGDPAERVTELYGQDYTENGTQLEYRRGDTLLYIILQDDFVASIEYRMAQ